MGFIADKETDKAVFALADTLKFVSRERIYSELKKLICGENALSVIEKYRDVLSGLMYIKEDISALPKIKKDPAVRFGYICGENVSDTLVKLKADNKSKKLALAIAFSSTLPNSRPELKKYISEKGREYIKDIIEYRRAVFGEDGENIAEDILSGDECLFVSDLDIKGSDLSALGIEGKNIKITLDILLDNVISEKAENKKELLLKLAKSIDNSFFV